MCVVVVVELHVAVNYFKVQSFAQQRFILDLCQRQQCNYLYRCTVHFVESLNPSTPNDHYSGRTAPLTSKRYILYIYSTNIGTEYFKHGI